MQSWLWQILAVNEKRSPISLTEISLRQNISLPYLEQIFIKLKNNNLVKSVKRSSREDIYLEKPASENKDYQILSLLLTKK